MPFQFVFDIQQKYDLYSSNIKIDAPAFWLGVIIGFEAAGDHVKCNIVKSYLRDRGQAVSQLVA